MKVVHVIPNLRKGGAERLALNIVEELSIRLNVEVVLVTFSEQNDYPFLSNSITWKVIPSKFIPSFRGKGTVEVEDLQNFIDEFNPDVIHSHLFEAEMVLSRIKFSEKVKRVFHFHSNMKQLRLFSLKTLVNKRFLTEYYERKLILKSYSENTLAICISEDTFKYADKVLPKKINKQLVFNAIDLKRFKPSNELKSAFEITIIGSLVNKKGQALAIESIGLLKQRGVEVKLNVLGAGPNLPQLKSLASKLNIDGNIFFYGNQDFPEQFLQRSLIYLHTAIYEPFGLVLIEAMACGLPVVCTDGFGNRELIKEGENGFMIWERDANLVADKLERLLFDTQLNKSMSLFSIKYSKDFGIDCYVDKLLSSYQKHRNLKT
jgi:glycosyltransferase involved in cell wall biosynthesis